ncbi:MAG: 50S ribosomal protein L1 [Candidatus Saccharimonadales bacterium]
MPTPKKAEDQALKQAEITDKVAPAAKKVDSAAKAGKRSPKAVRETSEKLAKNAKKAHAGESDAKAKTAHKPPRSRQERTGKKYREVAKQVDKTKVYSLAEAVDLATKTNPVKFDASVEIHINLNVDPTQADHNIRGSLNLPAGSGKKVVVAVFVNDEDAAELKKAGADLAGVSEILAKLDNKELSFDILISTPELMSVLSKYARLLGPKGLMPNPKSGTVTSDVKKAVSEAKAGRIEYRIDPSGIIHMAVGKVSFGQDKLLSNVEVAISAIRTSKPASLKGPYVKSAYISTSMGPSIKITV